MRVCWAFLAVVGTLVSVPLALGAEKGETAEAEQAIRAAMESYVQAFNGGDAAAVAAFWGDTGQYVGPSGERLRGLKAIQEALSGFFQENPGVRLEVSATSVRLISRDVAIEEGTARVLRPGAVPEELSYIAIHKKQKGGWKLDTVRETALPGRSSPYDQLKDLEWMIGDWVDQGEGATVETACQWTKNKSFITRTFRVIVGDQVDLEGTQVIGWDPQARRIRSWVFDSDGGFGEGRWTRKGNTWIVETDHVLPDGGKGTSVNVFNYIDENSFTWQAVGREIDGERLPDIEKVTVVRKQP